MSDDVPPTVVNLNEAPEIERMIGDHWGAAFKVLTPSMRPRGGSLGINHMRVPAGRTTCLYPDSGKVMVRSLKQVGRLEETEYFAGEDDRPPIFDLAKQCGPRSVACSWRRRYETSAERLRSS